MSDRETSEEFVWAGKTGANGSGSHEFPHDSPKDNGDRQPSPFEKDLKEETSVWNNTLKHIYENVIILG
jgi:hypothetical protein